MDAWETRVRHGRDRESASSCEVCGGIGRLTTASSATISSAAPSMVERVDAGRFENNVLGRRVQETTESNNRVCVVSKV